MIASCRSRVVGGTRSTTWCRPVGHAMPANATPRSPAGFGGSGWMSEPSWRAMSRSEPSSSCSSWRPQAEHRRHIPDAHPHAWVIQRHRDPAGRRNPSAGGDLAVVWVQGSWVSGPAQSEPTKVDVRGMIVWGKKPDGTWRVAMEHIGGEAGHVADHGLSDVACGLTNRARAAARHRSRSDDPPRE